MRTWKGKAGEKEGEGGRKSERQRVKERERQAAKSIAV